MGGCKQWPTLFMDHVQIREISNPFIVTPQPTPQPTSLPNTSVIVDAIKSKYDAYLKQLNEAYQKQYTKLQQQYIQLQHQYNKLQDKYTTLQQQYINTEQQHKTLLNKYQSIIPTQLQTSEIRASPSKYYAHKVLDVIKILLFNRPEYCYSYDDMMKLFDKLIEFINKSIGIPIALCIDGIERIRDCLTDYGAKGTRRQLQQKQSIISSLILLDENNRIMNKALLNKLITIMSRNAKDTLIEECTNLRVLFDLDESRDLCKDYAKEKRDSLVT